jgi:hypothetical protein
MINLLFVMIPFSGILVYTHVQEELITFVVQTR